MIGRVARLVAAGAAAYVLVWALAAPDGTGTSPRPEGAAEGRWQEEVEEARPDEWWLSQRLSAGPITTAALRGARVQADRLGEEAAQQAPALAAAPRSLVGPSSIGGRVVDIAVDPVEADTIYVAAATGGVWKSTNAGATFSPAWSGQFPQGMGALVAASDGTLYAGAGEANPGGGSLTYGGRGVYRSTDGGATWRLAGLRGVDRIGRIAVDPSDPARVFVAATGSLFSPGGPRGLYRSLDAGRTWRRVLAGANATTGAVDVSVDPTDPQRVYALMWDHLREPDLRTYGGVGSGVYRSLDGGQTWNRLENGLPAPSASIGRIGLGLATSDPDRLYVIVIKTNGSFDSFYTSTDGGDSWTKLPSSSILSSSQATFGWWFGRVWVDPDEPLRAFVGGVPLVVTSNGGTSWSTVGGSYHVDQHAMIWDPNVPGRVYLGNDGGVYRSDTDGNSPWFKGSVQPFTQFYSLDVSQQDMSRVVGGTQDNGSLRSYPSQWNAYGGGDGEQNLINYLNHDIVYACSQYGFCTRSTNGGDTNQSIGPTVSQRRNWFTPLEFDPTNPSVMYYGGNILNRSTNGGISWTAISPDLTGGPGPDPIYPFGTMTTVAAARTDGDWLVVGTDDGRVWLSDDLGANWTQAVDDDVPEIWVSRVVFDPLDEQVAYATFSGFRAADNQPYVAQTVDGGATWTDVSGNLPKAPVNAILVRENIEWIVATDVGVFSSSDGGATWLRVGRGLPNAPVTDLRIHEPSNTLFASTFGRGIYKVTLP